MKFNKCLRCGCFFKTDDSVCPVCKEKDEMDKKILKNFILENDIQYNLEDLSFKSGVHIKNVNRYFKESEFESFYKKLKKDGNISL